VLFTSERLGEDFPKQQPKSCPPTLRSHPSATMAAKHPSTTSQALFNLFIRPTLSSSRARHSSLHYYSQYPLQQPSQWRSISVYAKAKPTVTTKTMLKGNPMAGLDPTKVILDEQIGFRTAHLVTTEGSFQEPTPLRDLLSDIDRSTHVLRKVGTAADGIPVVKLVTKESLREEAKAKARQKTVKKTDDLTKQVELNWAITDNDLSYRMEWLRKFLREGRRVEVLIAPKRGGRRATKDEIQALLAKVRQEITDAEDGAEEWKDMLGLPGTQVTMYVQPRDGGGKARGEMQAKRMDSKDARIEKKLSAKEERKERLEKRLQQKKEEEERIEKERKEKLNLDV
jgi:translation initiation factor IF-3